MSDKLLRLLKIIKKLEKQATKTYKKHPHDLMDLGEVQAYKRCQLEIMNTINKGDDENGRY